MAVHDRLMPHVTDADCKLVGAGDGSVLVYCTPCRRCLHPNAVTLNAVLGLWEEHTTDDHQVAPERCDLCGRIPADGEQHRQVYGGGPTGDDVEEVCVGPDRRQLAYLPVPDPWLDPVAAADLQPPPF